MVSIFRYFFLHLSRLSCKCSPILGRCGVFFGYLGFFWHDWSKIRRICNSAVEYANVHNQNSNETLNDNGLSSRLIYAGETLFFSSLCLPFLFVSPEIRYLWSHYEYYFSKHFGSFWQEINQIPSLRIISSLWNKHNTNDHFSGRITKILKSLFFVKSCNHTKNILDAKRARLRFRMPCDSGGCSQI